MTMSRTRRALRAILTEVVVTIDDQKRTAALKIIWQGGSSTELVMVMTKAGGHARTTDEDSVSLVRRLATRQQETW